MKSIILRQYLAMGDAVLMTGLTRDIHLQYPGQFRIYVKANFTDLWENDPTVTILSRTEFPDGTIDVPIHYVNGILDSIAGQKIHMLASFHRDASNRLKVPISPTVPRPATPVWRPHEHERLLDKPYWVISAGGKKDATIKIWPKAYWQEVVYGMRDAGLNVVQIGVTHDHHIRHDLDGVIDFRDQTRGTRDLSRLIRDAEGVVCGITGIMHMAASHQKPCVVIGGGREEPWWIAYDNEHPGKFGPTCGPVEVPHKFFHTLGQLDCCAKKGCWQHRIEPLPDNHPKFNERLCSRPEEMPGEASRVPACMRLITPRVILDAVLSYVDAHRHQRTQPTALPQVVPG